MINLRRSYFSRVADIQERTLLGGGIEAMKGVYQSLRTAEVSLIDPAQYGRLLTDHTRARSLSSTSTSLTPVSGKRAALHIWPSRFPADLTRHSFCQMQ